MSSAQIVIEQSGNRGADGVSRDDLVLAVLVTLRNADDADVRSWRWTLEVPSGSSATLSNVVAAAPTFTPDVTGTYVVTLAVDEANVGQRDKRLAAVRNPSVTVGGVPFITRYVGRSESDEANWPSVYTPGTPNTSGWWEELDIWMHMIQTLAVAGGFGGESLQETYEIGATITTDAGNGSFIVSGTESWSIGASAGTGTLVSSGGLSLTSSAGPVELSTVGGTATVAGSASLSLISSGGPVALTASASTVTIAGNTGVSLSSSTGPVAITSTASTVTITAAGNASLSSTAAKATLSASTDIDILAALGTITVAAAAGAVAITSGTPASGNALDVTITAATALAGNGDGAVVNLDGGAPHGSGTEGYVAFRSAVSALVSEETKIFTIENRGSGTGGGHAVNAYLFEGGNTPVSVSLVAPTGSIALDGGSEGADGNLWVKTDSPDTEWHHAVQSLSDVYGYAGNLNVITTGSTGLSISGTAPWSLVGTQGSGTLTAGAPASGNAFDINVTAGTALAGNGNGGIINLIGGAPQGSGLSGYVAIKNAASSLVSEATAVAFLQNQGSGTGGGSGAGLFVVENAPSAGLAAAVGGFALRNVGGAGTEGQVWHKLGAGSTEWYQSGAYLKSATTRVDIGAATAPTAGQLMRATSSTVATWQDETRLRFTGLKTGAYTAVVGDLVLFDTTSFTFTLDLPASPATNDRVGFKQQSNSVVAATIDGNGNDVEDPATYILSSTVQLGGDGVTVVYQYDGTQWLLV